MADLTLAVMQPYFVPYAGYFRLFAASDLFVIYDCVQFPRRGWVHRNRLIDATGTLRWLTLPLEKAPRDALIRDLRFPGGVSELLSERLRAFPIIASADSDTDDLIAGLRDVRGIPLEYIERLLELSASYLELPWRVVRSSSLNIPQEFRGQARILEIARRLGASRYVNASGGRELYDVGAFEDAGIELRFLDDYQGPASSILQRMLTEDRRILAEDIVSSSKLK